MDIPVKKILIFSTETPPDKMCEIRGWKTHSTPELEKLAKSMMLRRFLQKV